MLVCNVSLRPPRSAIAATIDEAATAADATATGNIVFATLVDDPASVGDIVDAYSGEIMLEAASAADAPDGSVPAVYAADVAESATATDTASVPTAWMPSDLGAALRAWYKFDTLTGSNGDPQSALTDYSGNGFNLSQTGGLRATLAVAEQNGLNTLRFVKANTQYYQLSRTILNGGTAGSAYVVFRIVSDSVANGLMDWGNSGAGSVWPYLDGNLYVDFGSTVRYTLGNPSVTQTTHRIISLYSATNDWAFYIDGGTGGSSGGTSPFYSTSSSTVGWTPINVYLGSSTGASFPSSGQFLDGWIAEVILTSAKQSTTDRQKVEGYLAHKWGLTGNLSASHPYKTTPP